jgi:hypothetical protein
MPENKPVTFYRRLLLDAWKITWRRKGLWLFGIFAAAASTGGVMEVAFRSFRHIERGRNLYEGLAAGTVAGLDIFGQYLRQLRFMETGRVSAILTVITILGLALLIAAVWSRAALIIGAGAEKELPVKEVARQAAPHFWNVLAVTLTAKVASLLTIILTTLPLILYVTRATTGNAILYTISFLVFFPLTIIISIVSVLAVIDIIKRKERFTKAIEQALRLFGRHWLVTLELGIILFAAVMLAGMAVVAALVVLAIPYTILLVIALITATPFIFVLVHILGFTAIATVLLCYLGAATTFQHTAWLLFYERALKKNGAREVIAKLQRLWAR